MKAKGLLASSLLLFASPALGAEYRGQSIDGRPYQAKVYSYGTGGVFDAQVEFRGDLALVRFASGSQLFLRLSQSKIANPAQITAFGGVGQLPLNQWLGLGLNTTSGITGSLTVGGGKLDDLWNIKLMSEIP